MYININIHIHMYIFIHIYIHVWVELCLGARKHARSAFVGARGHVAPETLHPDASNPCVPKSLRFRALRHTFLIPKREARTRNAKHETSYPKGVWVTPGRQ